jgi:hypothetical protein
VSSIYIVVYKYNITCVLFFRGNLVGALPFIIGEKESLFVQSLDGPGIE